MVSSDWALANRKYSLDYVKDEKKAKLFKLGLWSTIFVFLWSGEVNIITKQVVF